jgi:hypothetical protein
MNPPVEVARLQAVADERRTVRFDVQTAKELCALPDPDTSDELLGPMIVRGNRTIVGAHTGHGKTTFEVQIARAVATGGSFLGFTGAGGRVLFVDAEQGLRTIKRRLTEAGLEDNESIEYLRVPDGLALDREAAERAELEAVLERDYSLVIADPLYKLHRGDSNAEREAVDLMRVFDEWRERYGFALCVATHCRKPPEGGRFTMHDLFGSGAYLRGAEVVIGLQFVRTGYSKLHFFKDRDGDLPVGTAWGLLFDRETGFRRDPNDGKPKETISDKVRAALEVEPGLSLAELMQTTGGAERTIRDALRNIGATEKPGPHNLKLWSVGEEGQL